MTSLISIILSKQKTFRIIYLSTIKLKEKKILGKLEKVIETNPCKIRQIQSFIEWKWNTGIFLTSGLPQALSDKVRKGKVMHSMRKNSPTFFHFLLYISRALNTEAIWTLKWLNFRNLGSLFLSGDKRRVNQFMLQNFKGKKSKYCMLWTI